MNENEIMERLQKTLAELAEAKAHPLMVVAVLRCLEHGILQQVVQPQARLIKVPRLDPTNFVPKIQRHD